MKILVRYVWTLALAFLLGTTAEAATETGTLNLCVGDVVNIYESHSSGYSLSVTTQPDTKVATASLAASSVTKGKFYIIEAKGVGTTTAKFQAKSSSNTREFTINVSAARTIAVGETKNVSGWGSSSESGSSSWSSSMSPSDLVTVNFTSQSTTAMAAKLTGKTVGSGTVTLKNVSSNSGSEFIYSVTVEEAKPIEPFDYKGCTVTVTGATTNYVDGELVLTFENSGSLKLSQDMVADVLVVGGGGGGGGAYYGGSSSKYNGNGGNGGEVKYCQGRTLPASVLLTAAVGTAGEGGAYAEKSTAANAGKDGGDSSLSGESFETIFANKGTKGAGGTSGSNNKDGSAGAGAATLDISGSNVSYGAAGKQAPSDGTATDVTLANGQGGQGGRASSTKENRKGGEAGSGLVVVRLKEVSTPREPMPWPTVATGLVYDGTVQTGVSTEGICQRVGTWAATDAGNYTVTVTPAIGFCWPDGTYGATNISWSIAKRPVTVSVVATNKVVGAEEPLYPTVAEGFVDDDAEVSWKVWRTNLVEQADGSLGLDERVGTYDLVVAGSTSETTNYTITYVNGVGAFEIRQGGPVIIDPIDPTTDPTIKPAEGTNGVYVVEVKTNETTVIEIGGLQPTDVVVVPEQIDTVVGVAATQVVVVAEATNAVGAVVKVDITDAFTITEENAGVTIALNTDPAAEVVVEIKGKDPETIKVTPELGTSAGTVVAEQPLVVADENVSVGVKTIPGLKYTLWSGETVTTIEKEVETVVARDTRVVLEAAKTEDPSRFYKVEVRK